MARSLLFLLEKIARRVAMPFCFCWKWHRCIVFRTEIDGLNRISVENKRVLSTLDQSSRIPILYMLYDSDIATGRGSAKVFGFEVVKGSTIEADTYLGHHRRSLGDRWRMLKSTNGGTITAAQTAPHWFHLVLCGLTWAPDRATRRCW